MIFFNVSLYFSWKHLLYALVLMWSNMKVAIEERWMANFPELFFCVRLIVITGLWEYTESYGMWEQAKTP